MYHVYFEGCNTMSSPRDFLPKLRAYINYSHYSISQCFAIMVIRLNKLGCHHWTSGLHIMLFLIVWFPVTFLFPNIGISTKTILYDG